MEIVIKLASSNLKFDELLKEVNSLNKKDDVVQIFNPAMVINKVHLQGAYASAVEAFRDKANLANTIALEMLLFASMQRQISIAIRELGARSSSNFIIFSNSKNIFKKMKKSLKSIKEFNPTKKEQKEIAKMYGIEQDDDKFVLQRMAIARIEA